MLYLRQVTAGCVAVLAWLFLSGFTLPARAACSGEDGGAGVVTEISGGDTLILDDGRAVRLSGVLGPKRAGQGPASEARAAMETALSELTLGRKATLKLGDRKRDRYGRLLAQVTVTGAEGEPIWVKGALVEHGLARVISFQDNRLCITELLELEELARQRNRGHWKSGFFAIRPASGEDLLYRLAQSYEIVEGRVMDVASVKGRTYLNFGKDWRRDFTAFIPAGTVAMFSAESGTDSAGEAFSLAELAGKRIRVRGWLRNYNGPSVTVSHPEQIELIEDDGVADEPANRFRSGSGS